tara:strand:+ start:231 stop:698 length:468 start_codon:yes stop_codon:yes gene_type:complete
MKIDKKSKQVLTKGNNMSETYKKTIHDKCPTCNQRWTREIDIPVPPTGIEFIAVQDNNNKKVELTITMTDVITKSMNGRTVSLTDLSMNDCFASIAILANKELKDGYLMRVDSNFMDTYMVSDRRFVLDTGNVVDALKTLKKGMRQLRRNRQIDG